MKIQKTKSKPYLQQNFGGTVKLRLFELTGTERILSIIGSLYDGKSVIFGYVWML